MQRVATQLGFGCLSVVVSCPAYAHGGEGFSGGLVANVFFLVLAFLGCAVWQVPLQRRFLPLLAYVAAVVFAWAIVLVFADFSSNPFVVALWLSLLPIAAWVTTVVVLRPERLS